MTTFTNELAVAEALEATETSGGQFLVVADAHNTPWIVYFTEDGDVYAHTAPDNGPLSAPSEFTKSVGALIAEQVNGFVRLVWDGVTV